MNSRVDVGSRAPEKVIVSSGMMSAKDRSECSSVSYTGPLLAFSFSFNFFFNFHLFICVDGCVAWKWEILHSRRSLTV